MAWDTQRTRRVLLEAATAEFSAHGLAGGRVDRIAASAGVNKQRIYKYFGSKCDLFDAVVAAEMTRVMALIPIVGTGKPAVLDYTRRMLDHHREDRVLARLLFWESLESRSPTASADRASLSREKTEGIAIALPGVSPAQAAELLFTIITLSCGAPILEPVDRLLLGTDADHAHRHGALVRVIGALIDDMTAEHDSRAVAASPRRQSEGAQ